MIRVDFFCEWHVQLPTVHVSAVPELVELLGASNGVGVEAQSLGIEVVGDVLGQR